MTTKTAILQLHVGDPGHVEESTACETEQTSHASIADAETVLAQGSAMVVAIVLMVSALAADIRTIPLLDSATAAVKA